MKRSLAGKSKLNVDSIILNNSITYSTLSDFNWNSSIQKIKINRVGIFLLTFNQGNNL